MLLEIENTPAVGEGDIFVAHIGAECHQKTMAGEI
jgi:hypothetical protein